MRRKNDIPLQHNVTLAHIYINPKILHAVLTGYNLSMSAKFVVNSKILHSWYIKREYHKFYQKKNIYNYTENYSEFTISPFH